MRLAMDIFMATVERSIGNQLHGLAAADPESNLLTNIVNPAPSPNWQ